MDALKESEVFEVSECLTKVKAIEIEEKIMGAMRLEPMRVFAAEVSCYPKWSQKWLQNGPRTAKNSLSVVPKCPKYQKVPKNQIVLK